MHTNIRCVWQMPYLLNNELEEKLTIYNVFVKLTIYSVYVKDTEQHYMRLADAGLN